MEHQTLEQQDDWEAQGLEESVVALLVQVLRCSLIPSGASVRRLSPWYINSNFC